MQIQAKEKLPVDFIDTELEDSSDNDDDDSTNFN